MRCPKCKQETSGNYCNYCGAPLMEEDRLLEENLADSLKSLFGDDDRQEQEKDSCVRENHRTDEAPLRAPRSRKSPKERKKIVAEKKKKSARSKSPEKERSGLRSTSRRREAENMYREEAHSEQGESAFQTAKKAAVKGAVGTIVICSRMMQILSAFLMAAMVARMAPVFLNYKTNLGLIDTMLTDRNYGLILYAAAAGFSLFMGAVWCLWILSKKAAGGQVRLKKYDVGRGFFPFLICLAAIAAAGFASPWIPAEAESLNGMAGGITALLAAVNGQRSFLFFCCVAGSGLSFVRRILRV